MDPTAVAFQRPPTGAQRVMLYASVIGVVALVVDGLTNASVQVSIAYAIPVVLAAWAGFLWFAILLGAFMAFGRLFLEVGFWHSDPLRWVGLVNVGIRLLVLVILAFLAYRGGSRSRALAAVLGTFGRLLPFCQQCGRIRDREGSWRTAESYVVHPSELPVGSAKPAGHTLCPDCERLMFGEFDRREVRRWLTGLLVGVAASIALVVWLVSLIH